MHTRRPQCFGFLGIMVLLAIPMVACRDSGTSQAVPTTAGSDSSAFIGARADSLLLASARIALPPPGIAPGDLPNPSSPEARLVVQYCNQCHDLPSPAMHSATDWPRVVRRMWLRMDRLPGSLGVKAPDEGDRAGILGYLNANALRVSGEELPAGVGREEFGMVCSRCHALPDIRNHSARDWPVVFRRMELNMERMNVTRPTGDQTSKILLYLQRVGRPE
jgi:cytochrome c5